MTTEKQAASSDQRESPRVGGGLLSRRWVIALLVIAVLVVSGLSGLPYGISYGLKQWFTSMGASSVEVGDVDFNPFTGRLHVKELQVTDEADTTMRVKAARFDFAWLPLWKKRFLLEAVDVEDGELHILREPEGGWVVGVIALAAAEPETPAEPTEWQVGLRQIEVQDLKVVLSLPQFTNDLRINTASIQRAVAWEPEVPASIVADCTLDGAPAQLDAEVFPFRAVPEAEGRLKVEGVGIERYLGLLEPTLNRLSGTANADLAFTVSVGEGITTSTEGSLSVQDAVVAGADFETAHQRLAWTGKVDLQSGENGQQIDGDGNLELEGVNVTLPGQSIDQGQLGYEGTFSVAVAQAGSVPAVTAEGVLSGSQLQVKLEESATALDQGALAWNGRVDVSSDDAGLRVQGDGTLESADMDLTLAGQRVTEEQLKWSGNLAVLLAEDAAASTVAADGLLESGSLAVKMADPALELEQAGIAWQGKIALEGLGDVMSVTSDGALKGGETRLESPDAGVRQKDFAWEGRIELERKPGADPVLAARGSLVGGRLDGRINKQQLRLGYQGLNWTGRIGSAAGDEAGASGSLKVSGITLRTPEDELTLASADEVRLDGLSMPRATTIDVADVQIDNLAAGVPGANPEVGGLARAGRVALMGIQWRAAERAAIESVTVDSLDVHMVRTAEGGWQMIDEIRAATGGGGGASPEEAAEAPAPGGSAASTPTLSIGRGAITGDSRIRFEDQAVEPAAVFDIALQEAAIGSLDTAQPAQEKSAQAGRKAGPSCQPVGRRLRQTLRRSLRGRSQGQDQQSGRPGHFTVRG